MRVPGEDNRSHFPTSSSGPPGDGSAVGGRVAAAIRWSGIFGVRSA
jgi:hypothetical protein